MSDIDDMSVGSQENIEINNVKNMDMLNEE